jgi:hypothetical protein
MGQEQSTGKERLGSIAAVLAACYNQSAVFMVKLHRDCTAILWQARHQWWEKDQYAN